MPPYSNLGSAGESLDWDMGKGKRESAVEDKKLPTLATKNRQRLKAFICTLNSPMIGRKIK